MNRVKKKHKDKSGLEVAQLCAKIALDTKAEEVVILNVGGISSFADYFVIMSGRSSRHVQGLAEVIENELSSKRVSGRKTEGLKEGIWVLLDYGDVIVHIFYNEARAFYDLDGLWHDAPKVAVEGQEGSGPAQ